jgi:hypothetical protein
METINNLYNKMTKMTGAAAGVKLEKETVVTLRERAKAYKVKGRWAMNKAQLIEALRGAYQAVGKKVSKKGKK